MSKVFISIVLVSQFYKIDTWQEEKIERESFVLPTSTETINFCRKTSNRDDKQLSRGPPQKQLQLDLDRAEHGTLDESQDSIQKNGKMLKILLISLQGTLTKGKCSVPLTSSLRLPFVNNVCNIKSNCSKLASKLASTRRSTVLNITLQRGMPVVKYF